MATGQPALHGNDLISTIMAVIAREPRPPHELEATVPPALSELIMNLLAKEARDRPASAQAVAETLERIAAVGAASRAAPQPRKKWSIGAGVAACLLLGLLGLWSAGVFKLKTKDGRLSLVPSASVRMVRPLPSSAIGTPTYTTCQRERRSGA